MLVGCMVKLFTRHKRNSQEVCVLLYSVCLCVLCLRSAHKFSDAYCCLYHTVT